MKNERKMGKWGQEPFSKKIKNRFGGFLQTHP